MSNVLYSIVKDEHNTVITVLVDGKAYVADETHPNFSEIVALATINAPDVVDLFDASERLAQDLAPLSERVSVANGRIYFDDDEIDNTLTRHIVRMMREKRDYSPFVNFLENLAQNPNSHSRDQLYDWLQSAGDFTITADGCFLAYKGVRPSDDKFYSISSGTAYVNGEQHRGAIPQEIGDTVTMPRSSVAFDPGVGCSTGLHAGTWEYASDFARGAVLTVKVNPRDVVSVPSDCAAQKLRTCRYEIVDRTEVEYTESVWDEVDLSDEPEPVPYLYTANFEDRSSNIGRAEWSVDTETVYVSYQSDPDTFYAYGCTKDQWNAFVAADSPGRFVRNVLWPQSKGVSLSREELLDITDGDLWQILEEE